MDNAQKMVELSKKWMELKEIEQQSAQARREIEDEIVKLQEISDSLDKTVNVKVNDLQIKITGRLTKKVDYDTLREIAVTNDLTELVPSLFRMKAEINERAWKSADTCITNQFSAAITVTPARPSFAISLAEDK